MHFTMMLDNKMSAANAMSVTNAVINLIKTIKTRRKLKQVRI
jgi:hypothetical protein